MDYGHGSYYDEPDVNDTPPEFEDVPQWCVNCKYFGRIRGIYVCRRGFFLEHWILGYPVTTKIDTCEHFQYNQNLRQRHR